MSVSVYYRSIDPMHPAKAFEIRDEAAKLAARFNWQSCDAPQFRQEKDAHLVGDTTPCFDQYDEAVARSSDDLHCVIEILRQLSSVHGVDWEVSHDYEPQGVGQIVSGDVQEQLIEEIDSVIQIGHLFGDVELYAESSDETWEQSSKPFGVWRSTIHETSASYVGDEPRVLKFPGVK